MKAKLTLFAILLCPIGLLAQHAMPGSQPATSASPTTIRGCLAGSPSSGTYTLTDQTGMIHSLKGSSDILRTLVGEEVEVNGQPASGAGSVASGTTASPASAGSNQPSASPANDFQVTDAKKIADHCDAAKSASSNSERTPLRQGEAQVAALLMSPVWQSTPGTASPVPHTATPQPGTATPGPGTATTPPRAATPTPGTASPVPGTATPAPSTATPGPGNSSATPGTASPTPSTATPTPNTTTPAPSARTRRPRASSSNQVPCDTNSGSITPDGTAGTTATNGSATPCPNSVPPAAPPQ